MLSIRENGNTTKSTTRDLEYVREHMALVKDDNGTRQATYKWVWMIVYMREDTETIEDTARYNLKVP